MNESEKPTPSEGRLESTHGGKSRAIVFIEASHCGWLRKQALAHAGILIGF